MHKLHYKGFGFFGCLVFSWFVLNIAFIWIERQSNFDDLLQNYSGFKYLVFGPYAETCILFPINLWLRGFWLNTSVYFHLTSGCLQKFSGLQTARLDSWPGCALASCWTMSSHITSRDLCSLNHTLKKSYKVLLKLCFSSQVLISCFTYPVIIEVLIGHKLIKNLLSGMVFL